ncbi:MAG: hexose kinase [Chitinispirillales bacterium]|nr:hexose kinase [Chitinispirillales bacterium]
MIVCTLLNPVIDAFYRVDGFELGTTRLDVASRTVPAGKGLNVARVVKTLGEEVAVAGLVPKNDMRRFEAFLSDHGIKALLYEAPGITRVNVTLQDAKTRCVTHINSASSVLPVSLQEDFLRFLAGQAEAGANWCFSGSLPSGFDDDVYARLIRDFRDMGVSCLLDTRGMALKTGARAAPHIITPNLTELQEFFQDEIKGVHHIALCGKRFIDMDVEYVFITLGQDGVIAIHEEQCLLCSPPDIKTVDTVGCGDAFAAGVMVAQKRNFAFAEMCRMAVACGASKSLHEGPGVVTPDEVWRLMEGVKITYI